MANSTNESVSYIVFQVPLSHAFLLEDQCLTTSVRSGAFWALSYIISFV